MDNHERARAARLIRIYGVMASIILFMLLVSCAKSGVKDDDAEDAVTVFAAASLINPISELAARFEAQSGVKVKCNFASSSTLARQIQAGAPADIYIAASAQWMNALEQDDLIEPASRLDLLGNALVLIAPVNETFSFDVESGTLESAFAGRLAIGDPDHVPAGIYAKQALESLGSWEAFQGRTVFANDARGALAFVERGEAAAGIVFATDARTSDRVTIVAEFPADRHEAIVYSAALTNETSEAGRRFFQYLQGDEASAVFLDAGFVIFSHSP